MEDKPLPPDEEPSKDDKPQGDPSSSESNNEDEILKSLRGDDFLNGILSDRDVSLVYIDRRRVNNYLRGEDRPVPRRTVEGATPATRIGDIVVNPLAEWERVQIMAVYRSTPRYEEALARFRQYGLLVLHGSAGGGKRATAIRLLNAIQFGGQQTPIYELNPTLRLAELQPDQLPADAALLLESRDGASLNGLTRFQLNTLLNALSPAQRNNGLIVVVDALPANFPAEQRHLCLDWQWQWPGDPLPAQQEVLSTHLRHFLNAAGEAEDVSVDASATLLADAALHALLSTPHPPAVLADLADLLVLVVTGRWTLDQALSQFGEQADKAVAAWFADNHPPDLENLLIAAAVFNGAVYEDVGQAAQVLERYFVPQAAVEKQATAPKPVEAPRPGGRFGGDHRQGRLRAICAHLEDRPQTTHYGEALAGVVVLDNVSWQETILKFIWKFDEWREPVLKWLYAYAHSEKVSLRARAAAALGALACQSFHVIEREVMRPWAGSRDAGERRSVAQILGITMWDERYSSASAGLLHYYASQQGNPRYQWTAALAYAGLAGPRYPQQTLADLRTIAANAVAQPFLIEPIVQAVWAFYGMARSLPDRRLALLHDLAAWGDNADADRSQRPRLFAEQRTALLSVIMLLWPAPNDQVWQMLVTDAGIPGEAQTALVDLLRRALNFRQPQDRVRDGLHPRKFTLDCLEQLIRQTPKQGDPNLIANLEGLLQALVDACRHTDPDEVDRLRYAAEGWDELPDASRRLAQILLVG